MSFGRAADSHRNPTLNSSPSPLSRLPHVPTLKNWTVILLGAWDSLVYPAIVGLACLFRRSPRGLGVMLPGTFAMTSLSLGILSAGEGTVLRAVQRKSSSVGLDQSMKHGGATQEQCTVWPFSDWSWREGERHALDGIQASTT